MSDYSNERSTGHLAIIGDYEYFTIDNGNLYAAPTWNPLDINGYRQGARFECTAGFGPEYRVQTIRERYNA